MLWQRINEYWLYILSVSSQITWMIDEPNGHTLWKDSQTNYSWGLTKFGPRTNFMKHQI